MNPRPANTVLGLFAHPDDETFGPGGTLATLATEGHSVHLLCATRGEAGTIGESASHGRQRLAAIRTGELAGACAALGLTPPELLDLPDGGLAALPPDALLRPMVRSIRVHRPALLMTFDRGGLSGHPDHRTVTARALEAFELAATAEHAPELGPPHAAARLWTFCFPASRASRVTFREMVATADADIDAAIEVLGAAPRRRAAIDAHATQKPFIERLEAEVGDLDAFWSPECFVLEKTRVPLPKGKRPVSDLFAGM